MQAMLSPRRIGVNQGAIAAAATRLYERQSLPDNGEVARTHQEVLDTLRERLARRPEILEAYCFGSYARGEAAAHGDLDIAVYVDRERLPPVPFGYAAELISELMAGLGFDRLDVVVLNNAPPLLYHRVLRDGERLLSRDLAA